MFSVGDTVQAIYKGVACTGWVTYAGAFGCWIVLSHNVLLRWGIFSSSLDRIFVRNEYISSIGTEAFFFDEYVVDHFYVEPEKIEEVANTRPEFSTGRKASARVKHTIEEITPERSIA